MTMITRYIPLFMVLALVLAACGSASTPVNPPAAATEPPALPQPTATLAPAGQGADVPAEPAPATEPAAAIPAATSRGPDLHATDPSTVNLASGGLQFVEFFRFT